MLIHLSIFIVTKISDCVSKMIILEAMADTYLILTFLSQKKTGKSKFVLPILLSTSLARLCTM